MKKNILLLPYNCSEKLKCIFEGMFMLHCMGKSVKCCQCMIGKAGTHGLF